MDGEVPDQASLGPRRWWQWLWRCAAVVFLSIGFWSVFHAWSSLPPWQVAVLPAALVGWLLAHRAGQWTCTLVLLLSVAALGSAALGEWLGLKASLEARLTQALQEPALPDAAALVRRAQGTPDLSLGQETAVGPPGPPPVQQDPQRLASAIASQQWYRMAQRRWPSIALSFLVSVLGTFQAARMSIAHLR